MVTLTNQLEELTQLVKGMTTTWHPNHYFRNELGTTSGKAMPQSDMLTGVHRTRDRRRSRTSHNTDDETTYPAHDRRLRQPTQPKMNYQYEYVLDAITT